MKHVKQYKPLKSDAKINEESYPMDQVFNKSFNMDNRTIDEMKKDLCEILEDSDHILGNGGHMWEVEDINDQSIDDIVRDLEWFSDDIRSKIEEINDQYLNITEAEADKSKDVGEGGE